MGASMFELRGGEDLNRVSHELRAAGDGKELTKQLRKEIRSAARPLVPLVRSSIRSIPAKRGYSASGLRGAMSRATGLSIRTTGTDAGVVIRVDGRKMPSHAGTLPAYMEGTKPRWRHPVFGNTENWVDQESHPYFYRVVLLAGIRARVGVNRALDTVSKKIT